MHKIRVIESTLGYPQKNRMESESYEGVQTYMDMKDGSLIAVQPNKDDLMSQILSPDNLNRAYLQVVRNKGVEGVDKMDFKPIISKNLRVMDERLFVQDGPFGLKLKEK